MSKLSINRGIFAAFVLLSSHISPAIAQSAKENGENFSTALSAIQSGDWDTAITLASRNQDPIAAEMVEWYRLRDGDLESSFAVYEAFMETNHDWPGLALLQKHSEKHMAQGMSPQRVINYFANREPQTATGALRLAQAYKTLGQNDQAAAEAVRAWRSIYMSASEQSALLSDFGTDLQAYHWDRVDFLLFNQRAKEAERMLPMVSDAQRKLAEVRIALMRNQNGVDALIAALPAEVRDDAGLAYERFRWRASKGYTDSAAELLLDRSSSLADLGRPEYWSSRRRTYARRAMRAGDNQTAYNLASQHFLTPDQNGYSDLEWLSGFLALRKLNNPALALEHFQKFRASIKSPISVGRAGYWLGRAYEASGDTANANAAYGLGATYQTSFYGQLAAERANMPADQSIAGAGLPPDWTGQPFLQSDSIRAGLMFHFAGEEIQSRRFFQHAAESMSVAEMAALGQLAMDLGQHSTAVRVGKTAAKTGDVIPFIYYPLTDLADFAQSVPAAMAMAIARQESELYAQAQSPVGALGLMQVMPATAKNVARDVGVAYSKSDLLNDWQYNATLGTAYLAEMLERYNGSTVLAAAAYNAGPHRADRWINDYGDPRKANVDVIDWIESIPFRETRNYVMRVNESLFIYRSRISGQAGPLQLASDLKIGG